jgi:hypothetical protein
MPRAVDLGVLDMTFLIVGTALSPGGGGVAHRAPAASSKTWRSETPPARHCEANDTTSSSRPVVSWTTGWPFDQVDHSAPGTWSTMTVPRKSANGLGSASE